MTAMSSTHSPTFRPPIADLDSALSPLPEADLHREQPRLAPARIPLDVLFEIRRDEGVLERGLPDRLSRVPVESRLRIEALDVARAADHEQPDHTLGLRGEVRLAVGRGPNLPLPSARDAVAVEHRAEREAGEPHAAVGQERAARYAAARSTHVSVPVHFLL